MADPVLLASLYDDHAQAIFAYALDMTRNQADARDVLQEVFLKLARQPDSLDTLRDPRGYLLRLAHNVVVDLYRRQASRQRRHESLAAEGDALFAPPDDPDEIVFCQKLSEALAALPAEQRAVVHLKIWEGMTFEAMAAVLGISSNTAASRYRYALDKLRAWLRPLHDELRS